MKYDLKTPCVGCPFNTNAPPGYLGGVYTAKSIIADLCNEVPFICHVHVENTTGYEGEDWQERLGDKAQHCAGALIMQKKMCKIPRDPEHAEAVLSVDKNQEILFPPQAFIDYHTDPEGMREYLKKSVPTAKARPTDKPKRLGRNKRSNARARQ